MSGHQAILCDRCGQCCYHFNHTSYQIYFKDSDSFLTLPPDIQESVDPNLVPLYNRVKPFFIQQKDNTKRYLIPTKLQLQKMLSPSEFELVPPSMKNGDECMFLFWEKENQALCRIHQFKPDLCRVYPTNKGGVCLNHYEKRMSMEFLAFQQSEIGYAVKALKHLYSDKFEDPVAYEILTLLMDFGTFPLQEVEDFFARNFQVSKTRFQAIIDQLYRNFLLFQKNRDQVEGISMKEVEKLVDGIMAQNGWIPPN